MANSDVQESQPMRSDSSVDLFMTKLEHRLPEIRTRAAGSLASAVSLGLLPADQLAARLRERLQLPSWPGREQALQLLSQLQLNALAPTPDEKPPSSGRSRSHVRTPDQRALASSPPKQTPGKTSPHRTQPLVSVPAQLDMSCAGDYSGVRASTPVDWDNVDSTLEIGLLDQTQDPDTTVPQPANADDKLDIVERLPWKPLIPSDMDVLASTAASLGSGDGAAVRRALQFTCDVALRDFPAEVFLQRSQLLQALFHVLATTPEADTDVLLSCLAALTSLACQLLHRCDVTTCPDTRQPAALGSTPPPGSESSSLPLPVFCGQLLSQAVSGLYVRHWAALRSAAQLGSVACELARRCVPPDLWTRRSDGDDATKAAAVKALKVFGEVLHWHRQCYQAGDSVRLHRTGWLLTAHLLSEAWGALRPPSGGWARRRGVLSAPVQVLFDDLLFAQQPELHSRMLALCQDEGCTMLWQRVARMRRAMEAARRLTDDLSDALLAVESAELHGGAALTEQLVDVACSVASQGPSGSADADADVGTVPDTSDRDASCARLLLRLLTGDHATVRAAAYRRAAAAARAALRDTGRRSLLALLQPRVLELALDEGLSDPQTERDASDIILYIVTAEAWVAALRPHLVAALPLMLCHVTRPQLTRPLNHVIALAGDERLRGDLILTTHENRTCREDAWTRIIGRLSTQNTGAALLPDLSQLGPLDLAELMLVEDPPPVCSRRGQPNDVMTLTALMPLAWCGTASLEVRRATLCQIAILLQDADLHRAFLDHDGLPRLVRLITRAIMKEPDLTHDVSLLPDCVTLLRLLALLSPGCRRHLADDFQLQLLLVRVLLMFRLDEKVRAAAAQLLVALSLDQSLTCQRTQGSIWCVAVPQVMAKTLRLPFDVVPKTQRRLGRAGEELPASVLSEPVAVSGERLSLAGLLRAAWGLAWHGSLGPQPAHQEYSEQLRLPDWQLAAAGAGQLQLAAAEVLQQLDGVTSHTAARVLLAQLSCCTRLYTAQLSDRSQREGVFADSSCDRWLSVLKRHLLASPATEPDRRVLVATMELLLLLPPDALLPARAVELLSDHSRLLTETLARATGEYKQGHNRTALRVLQLLAELCQRRGGGATSLMDSLSLCVVEAAELAGTVEFYSLAAVQRSLAVLQVSLLSGHQLSSCLLPAVRLFRQLCQAFLPQGGLTESCVGAGVLASTALCLHSITQQQGEWSSAWEECWRAQVPDGGQLLWLGALWHHNDVQIRWGGVATVLGLARWPQGAEFVTKQLHHMPGGVWDSALSVLVSGDEAAAVREQAALLLASLTSRLTEAGPGQITGPEVAHADAEVCLMGVPALVILLERADWCGQLCGMISQLHDQSLQQTLVSTPGLVAAALRLTHNAAVISPSDLVPRLPDVIHSLIQSSDALSVGGAETHSCWAEALRLCTAAVQLEAACTGVRHLLLCDTRLLDAAAAAASEDGGLRAGLFRLLETLLSADLEPAFATAADLLCRWPELAAALTSAPSLLETILSEESARTLQLVPGKPRLGGLGPAGAALCAALLPPTGGGQRCLSALLLVSASAKQEALDRKLHMQITRQLKEKVAELVTGSLSVRAAMSKNKEKTLMSAVLSDMDLLRNLMSGSGEAKTALAAAGLPDLLHKLWPWCVTSRRLAVTVLCTLNTLAAGCADGARRLAYTSPALHQGPSSSPSGSSLVHAVLEDCRRQLSVRATADSNGTVQRLAVSFSLLAAAALVPEGRSIICRSTFLSQFRYGRSERTAPGSQQRRHQSITRLWLLLIKNVTFFEEGQKVVARIPEVTGSLVALLTQDDTSIRSSAVLVLRNLSYLNAMQTALINTDGFVSGVAAALRSGHPVACCAAVALCWQLLSNNRKARALLTSAGHLEKLRSAVDTLDGATDEETAGVLVRVRDLLKQDVIGLSGT